MKKIKVLYDRLQKKYFKEKYPNFNLHDGKIHLLYLAPCLNRTGYYRAILPALELERTGVYSVILSSLHKWDFTKSFSDYDSPVDQKLIEWADYFIMPSITSDISYILDSISELNANIQFVMDLDLFLHAVPEEHPRFNQISKESKSQFLSNLAKMDVITGAASGQLDSYEELIERNHPDSNAMLGYIPNLISQIGYEEVKSLEKATGEKVKIGIISDFEVPSNLKTILEVLNALKDEIITQVEVVFVGWSKEPLKNKLLPNELEVSYQKTVSILDYFNCLNELRLDMALLPLSEVEFNTKGKTFIQYAELAALTIPVIAIDQSPYNEVIEHGETGLLAENQEAWLFYIEALIHEPSERERIGKNAMKNTWSRLSYTHPNLQFYKRIFT